MVRYKVIATDLGRQERCAKPTHAINADEVTTIYQKAFISQLETYIV